MVLLASLVWLRETWSSLYLLGNIQIRLGRALECQPK